MKKKWHIVDWAGNEKFNGEQFDSFEDGMSRLHAFAEKTCKTEKEIDDYLEDMFVEVVE